MLRSSRYRKLLVLMLIFFAVTFLPMLWSRGYIFGIFGSEDSVAAEIWINGSVESVFDLGDSGCYGIYNFEGELSVVIEVNEYGICFLESDCPDKICVNTGKLTYPMQTAVCLPARVSVVIRGEGSVDVG